LEFFGAGRSNSYLRGFAAMMFLFQKGMIVGTAKAVPFKT